MKNIDPNYCKKKDIINYWKFRFKLFFNSSKNIIDNKDVSKYNISKDEGGIWDLLMLSLTETYTIARMFRQFKNIRNIENCELHQSLKKSLEIQLLAFNIFEICFCFHSTSSAQYWHLTSTPPSTLYRLHSRADW